VYSVDIRNLQGDVAPAECLTNRIDGRGAVFLQKKEAIADGILAPSARRTARLDSTRLKLVRRQMYGRGKIDLLQARSIGAE